MKKFMYRMMIFLVLISPVFVSCINSNSSSDYTAEKEQQLLDDYLAGLVRNGYNVDTTSLGVYYVKLIAGTGAYPAEGDTISVKYVGYLMDGSVFDHTFYSSSDSSWTYLYKTTKTISSWEEMMGLMNKGCKMEFIIPSSLAYGAMGAGTIPPYSSLIFVAIMNNVRKVIIK